MVLPRLYAIADVGTLARAGLSLRGFAEELREAGVKLIQYRDKDADDDLAGEGTDLTAKVDKSRECSSRGRSR